MGRLTCRLDRRAVSSAVSTALLVAVVLLLVASVGLFVFDLTETTDPAPTAKFVRTNDSHGVSIEMQSGKAIEPDRLEVVGTDPDRSVTFGTWGAMGGETTEGEVRAGNVLHLLNADGDESITLVWTAPDRNSSFVLASYGPLGGTGESSGYSFQGDTKTGDYWGDVDALNGTAWDARGRWGGTGQELQIRTGSDTATGGHTWQRNVTESFTLRYHSSTDTAGLSVGGDPVSSTHLDDPGNKFTVTVKDGNDTSGTAVAVENLSLDGAAIGPKNRVYEDGGVGSNKTQYLLVNVSNTDLSDGFTLRGTVTFDWGSEPPTSDEALAFTIDFGTE
jgi:FlaG/FlaF family flagellin (archaellin)